MSMYRYGSRGSSGRGFIAVIVLVIGAAAGHHAAVTPGGSSGGGGGSVPQGSAERLGASMAAAAPYYWAGGEWTCLDELWTRESSWSDTAANPASDARGIAQDINGWSAGNPYGDAAGQISWGLAYISSRYGSPCAAWGHEEADGWY